MIRGPSGGFRHYYRSALGAGLSVVLAAMIGGCAIAAAGAQKLGIGTEIQPLYVPQAEPMLVLVENYELPSLTAAESENLAVLISDDLRRHEVAPLIEPERVFDLRTRRPEEFRRMSIATVGRELEAVQVLYVELLSSNVSAMPGSGHVRGQISARLRIVDVASGETLWPTDSHLGFPISYETPVPRSAEAQNVSAARQQLYRGMALRIGRLFRKWDPADPGEDDEA